MKKRGPLFVKSVNDKKKKEVFKDDDDDASAVQWVNYT